MSTTLLSLAEVLFLSLVVAAKPLHSLDGRGSTVIVGYEYTGCYTEAISVRALSANAFFDDLMTVEKCAVQCSAYTYFGVEYGKECYCGNTLNPGSVPAAENQCDFLCPGDGAETCGAGNRLNVYSKAGNGTAPVTATSTGTAPITASTSSAPIATYTGYEYTGCYTEATNMRALSAKVYYDDLMTIEKCALACSSYTYFGAEYGKECYCGNTLNPGSVPTAENQCDFSCPGDGTEMCGAGNRLNVYSKAGTGTAPVNTTGTAPLTASTSSAPAASPAGYVSKGCFSEGENGRALTGKVYYDDSMTTGKCAAQCAGFIWFGLEYQQECYCGNTLGLGSVEVALSDCKYPCPGNQSQTCGGDNRLNMYMFEASATSTATNSATPTPTPTHVSVYTPAGCWTEATDSRALTGAAFFDDLMTIEKCEASCTGWIWFGVEYGKECYCGNTIMTGSVETKNSECSFPCPGDSTELCGAGNRLNMYYLAPLVSSNTSSTVTTISTMSTLVEETTSTISTTVAEFTTSTKPILTTSQPSSIEPAFTAEISSESTASSIEPTTSITVEPTA